MDFESVGFVVGIGIVAGAVQGFLTIVLTVLVILLLLDTRRFIAELIPLMRRTNRWLASREDPQ